MDINTIESALDYISPDLPRDEWAKIGMAIKSEFPDDHGFSIFDTWSRNGATYKKKDCLSTWRSVKPSGGVTVGTLFHLAKESGWKGNKPIRHDNIEKERRLEKYQKEQEANAKKRQYAIDKVLSECTSIESTMGMDYLENRLGTRPATPDLLFHPNLQYFDSSNGTQQGAHPAIVAKIISPENDLVTLHRTYLSDTQKAPVDSPKKIMGVPYPKTITGAAIHLFKSTETLILAEGIETALALTIALDEPAWACISAHFLSTAIIPYDVKTVIIGADNDRKHTGQISAYTLANRLRKEGKQTRVMIPDEPGDWLNVLLRDS